MSFRKIGALWTRTGKEGNKYLGGEMELEVGKKQKIVIFKNDHKVKDTEPDYVLRLFVADESVIKPAETDDVPFY